MSADNNVEEGLAQEVEGGMPLLLLLRLQVLAGVAAVVRVGLYPVTHAGQMPLDGAVVVVNRRKKVEKFILKKTMIIINLICEANGVAVVEVG